MEETLSYVGDTISPGKNFLAGVVTLNMMNGSTRSVLDVTFLHQAACVTEAIPPPARKPDARGGWADLLGR